MNSGSLAGLGRSIRMTETIRRRLGVSRNSRNSATSKRTTKATALPHNMTIMICAHMTPYLTCHARAWGIKLG